MKIEFAKYTDVTDYAREVSPQHGANDYIGVLVCPDVENVWLVRILDGWNDKYEREEGAILIERDNVYYDDELGITKGIYKIDPEYFVKKILENDDFENWDTEQCASLEEALELLSDGFGIN